MKSKCGIIFFSAIMIFMLCQAGAVARSNDAASSLTTEQQKRIEQMLKFRAARERERQVRLLEKSDKWLMKSIKGEISSEWLQQQPINIHKNWDRAQLRKLKIKNPETTGSATARINAPAGATGSISGRVTDISSVGIEYTDVNVFDLSEKYMDSVSTDASGNYSVTGLPSGSYKVRFNPSSSQNYLSEWYNNKYSYETADPVAVTAGGTTPNINAQLATGGTISGKVTDASAAGIEDINVNVYDLNQNYLGDAYTDASGNYSVIGLPSGSYKVQFDPSSSQNYVGEWYNNKSDFATADPVAVTAGSTTPNINAQLSIGGTISGRVTDASTAGISGIHVNVYDLNQNYLGGGYTDASGNYSVVGLPSTSFKVQFDPSNGQNYLSEWYNNKSDFATADPVAVIAGGTTPNINAQLAIGGTISGKVTDDSATGIAGIYVYLYDLNQNFSGNDYTDDSGNYSLVGLPSGSYKVEFDLSSGRNYQSEWYNDKSDFATADPVAVTAGSTTPNINAQLATGGIISGRVVDASATGLAGIEVDVYDSNYNGLEYAITDTNGYYSVNGLPSGNLKVQFNPSGQNYAREWYNDKATFVKANFVAVTAGSTTADINAQLAIGGGISGQILEDIGDKTGEPIAIALNEDCEIEEIDDPGSDGYYSIGNLAAGVYKVLFYDGYGVCVNEFYDDKPDFSSANPVVVVAGSTTPNINAQLALTAGDMLTLLNPNGGESWTIGSVHNLFWSASGSISSVNIDYSTNNGGSWTSVASGTSNDMLYSWTVPNSPSTSCLIRLSDANDGVPTDQSDAVFSIVAASSETVSPPTTPTGPASGEISTSYNYSTSGATSSLGHSVQYKFDWDDGSDSGWLAVGTTSASHGWAAAGTYDVRAMARCATDTAIESLWSATYAVAIGGCVANDRDDLLATWNGQGVYYKNSDTGAWVKLATPATLIANGDLDNDCIDDIIGIWPSQGGVWVKYSASGAWAKLSSTARHLATGDMNGDGQVELLGTWDGQGVYWRNNTSGVWTKLATPATLITAGDLDSDGTADLVGIWPSQGGVWVKYSSSGAWAKLSTTAVDIATGDMNGDGRDDLVATWDGQGVYYKNSANGAWVKLATPATQVTAGDLDGDGTDDTIGIWPSQAGVWVKYSATGAWAYMSTTAVDIAAGKMRAAGSSSLLGQGATITAESENSWGPDALAGAPDLSEYAPDGMSFACPDGENLEPSESGDILRIPGPGEPGFTCQEQENLEPPQAGNPDGIRERK